VPEPGSPAHASRARIVAAFAAVYVVWGSTYLAIRYAIETLPPFLMAATRFLVAGALLYGWARWRGARAPRRADWKYAMAAGGLLLLGGNGAVVWAEQHVPSGLAALLIATVPLWMVILEWVGPRGRRPGRRVVAGLCAGFAGLALLVGPGEILGRGQVDPVGALVLVLGALSWATGSLVSRSLKPSTSPLLLTAMNMLGGGALLLAAGVAAGELGRLHPGAFSARSVLALAYLIVAGSLVGFTSYLWLLRATSPARVSTYAYVNPVVAVLLGWALAGEPLTPRVLVAAMTIVGAVAVIVTPRALLAGVPGLRNLAPGAAARDGVGV